MEAKKMGRPTTQPKVQRLELRLSQEDADILESLSKKTGLSKADVIRKAIREFNQ